MLPARGQYVHEVLVENAFMNLGPTTVSGAPKVADGVGGGGEGAPDRYGEGFTAGESPVVGDILVTDLWNGHYCQLRG